MVDRSNTDDVECFLADQKAIEDAKLGLIDDLLKQKADELVVPATWKLSLPDPVLIPSRKASKQWLIRLRQGIELLHNGKNLMRWKAEKHDPRRMLSSHLKDKPAEILVPRQKHRAELHRLLQYLFIQKPESELLNESHRMAPYGEHSRHIRRHILVG